MAASMDGSARKGKPLILSAFLLLCVCVGWTLLSRDFHYGRLHQQRPIIPVVVLYLTAGISFWLAFLTLRATGGSASTRMVIGVALLLRLALLPSQLIQENDVYRYVLEGQVVRHGLNPYTHSPRELQALPPEALKQALDTEAAKTTLSRIGYPEIPSVYPPLAQLTFALGSVTGGWHWQGQRWVFMAVDLAALLLLLAILRATEQPAGWLILYAWNPLILKEVVNSVHLDVLLALFVTALIGCLYRYHSEQTLRWLVLSAVALGLAVLSKLYPVVLGPACLFYLWRRSGQKSRLILFSFVCGITVLAGFAPFLQSGWVPLTAGLRIYADRWLMNEGAFSLIQAVTSQSRPVSAGLILLLSILIPAFRGAREPASLAADFCWILLLWFLLIPAPFPWYAVPLAALLVLTRRTPAAWASLALSSVAGLYYMSFFFEYHNYPLSWWSWTRGIEHGLVWAALAAAWLLRRNGAGETAGEAD